MIAVDPDYIRQMVDNIIINAITYTSEGLIKVFVYKVSHRVELIIEDQGMGIPQKDIYDIFDPFKMGTEHVAGQFGPKTFLPQIQDALWRPETAGPVDGCGPAHPDALQDGNGEVCSRSEPLLLIPPLKRGAFVHIKIGLGIVMTGF